ncbi:MAG TPA: trypsin-like peptidase domain-containing protein [Holophagaceae bacterium]|nr:trypsin-like peptidase domain-containing protein [Holophagaceae bacterium]
MLPQALPPAALARAQASLVEVHSIDAGRVNQWGGGVVVAPWTVATSAHVVRGHEVLEVRQGRKAWRVKARREDGDRDLCLLYVPGLALPAAELGDPESLTVGQAVFSLGFPGGEGTVSPGTLQGLWCFRGGLLLQSDAATGPGSSGGGLFDPEGRLLGLNAFIFPDQPRLSFAVPVTWVRSLEAPDAQTGGGAAPLAPEFLGSLASDPANWPEWVAFTRAWVRSAPSDPKGWTALGQALDARRKQLEAQGQAEAGDGPLALEAQGAYRRALDLRVENARAWNNLGVALDGQNRLAEAMQAFQNAVDLWPEYGLAWNNLGKAAFNARRHALALDAFRRGLELVPDDASAWADRGDSETHLGLKEAAETSLAIAARLRPFRAEAWLDLGRLRLDLGRREGAQECVDHLQRLGSPLAGVLRKELQAPRKRKGRGAT